MLITLLTFCLPTTAIGFQGDDWQHLWLFYRVQDLDPAFLLHRIGLQWWYEVVMPLLDALPWQWFLLSNLLRWAGGSVLYRLGWRLFPAQRREAAWFALLFVLYPGYTISFMPVTFWRGYLESFLLITSFYCMVRWLQETPRRPWLLMISLLAGLGNLISTEYFLLLELLRPAVIWLAVRKRTRDGVDLRLVLKTWLPYVGVFLAALAWRLYAIEASGAMGKTILPDLAAQPFASLLQLAQNIWQDFGIVILQPVWRALQVPASPANPDMWLYLFVCLLVGCLVAAFFHFQPPGADLPQNHKKRIIGLMLGLALISFLLAGAPFWIKKLQVVMGNDVRNRYAMTQGFGFALLLVTALLLIPRRRACLGLTALSLLCGLFAGLQVQAAGDIRVEYELHRQFLWQLAWRAPAIQPGATIILNDPGFVLSGENSFSSELNWNYVAEEHPDSSDYFIYFDEHRFLADFPTFPQAEIKRIEHLGGWYELDSSQMLVMRFTPDGCLRILDAELDALDESIVDFSRRYIKYSDLNLIQAGSVQENGQLDPYLYEEELDHGWCYYFQKADLASQLGDWQAIVELGKQAFLLPSGEQQAVELRPFIEGYARSGDWQTAMQLTERMLQGGDGNAAYACAVWQRILAATPLGNSSSAAVEWLRERARCGF